MSHTLSMINAAHPSSKKMSRTLCTIFASSRSDSGLHARTKYVSKPAIPITAGTVFKKLITSMSHYLWRETACASLLQFSPPNIETHFRDQNKAGHGAVSFGNLGANRMAVIAPLLRQLLTHTGVTIHDLSGAEMAVFKVTVSGMPLGTHQRP